MSCEFLCYDGFIFWLSTADCSRIFAAELRQWIDLTCVKTELKLRLCTLVRNDLDNYAKSFIRPYAFLYNFSATAHIHRVSQRDNRDQCLKVGVIPSICPRIVN